MATNLWKSLSGRIRGDDGSSLAPGSAYTQTYATAARTVPAAVTQTVVTGDTVTKTNTTPYGFSSTDADKIVTFYAAAQVDFAAIIADLLAQKKVLNALIDDLQALGFAV